MRLAIVVSHPIQHFCPQYASFAKHPSVKLKVFFGSSLGHKSYFDAKFGQNVAWDNLRLNEFEHEFLNNGEIVQPDKDLDAPEIVQKLEAFKPDVVIVYGYFQKISRRAYKWARQNGVRIAYISDTEMRRERSKIKELIKYPWLRRYFSGIDWVLTVGDANEAYYKHVGVKKEKMLRMHFPIDIELYKASYAQREALRAEVRQRFGIPENETVAAVVGKLVSSKHQDHIIDAMQQLEATGRSMHLFVLGSGEILPMLEEKAAKLKTSKVHFPGFVTPGQLPAYYAAADIYIHPASVDAHPLAVSEALYLGSPAIVSDRCGSWGDTDDVQQGRNGFVYPCGNIGELSNHIAWMIDHPAERLKFGAYSHNIAVAFQEKSHKLILDALVSRVSQPVKDQH